MTKEYKKEDTPVRGPTHFESSGLLTFLGLTDAQDIVKDLSELPSSVRSASYLADETLTLNGRQITCYVIEAQGGYHPGWSSDTTLQLTVWVDKENHLIRKLRERMEGRLIVNDPQGHRISDKTTVYGMADLDVSAIPNNLFAFSPPPTARLVEEFQKPGHGQWDALLVDKAAPDVNFNSMDGKVIPLKSFQGKPVLLDFWATWCGPCLESMPSLTALYREAVKHGLVMLSIDEDDDAAKAADFLFKNHGPWPNFHDDCEIVRLFPNHGIPHFVLINSAGKVVFSNSGFDENSLRAALANLGPEFASLAKTPESLPLLQQH